MVLEAKNIHRIIYGLYLPTWDPMPMIRWVISIQAGEKTFKYKVVSHTNKVKVNSGQDLRLAQADILDELPEEGATGKTTGTVEDTIDEVEGKSTETKVLKLRYIEYATGFTAGSGGDSGGDTDGGKGGGKGKGKK